jgi:hypothetical protein
MEPIPSRPKSCHLIGVIRIGEKAANIANPRGAWITTQKHHMRVVFPFADPICLAFLSMPYLRESIKRWDEIPSIRLVQTGSLCHRGARSRNCATKKMADQNAMLIYVPSENRDETVEADP